MPRVNGSCNLHHNGRRQGAKGRYTRVLKQALIYAAEKSKNSKSPSLEGYCIFLADDKPELFVSLLGRLIPLQAKIETNDGNPFHGDVNIINFNMPLSDMVSTFEQRIMSAYVPTTAPKELDFIEHMDAED